MTEESSCAVCDVTYATCADGGCRIQGPPDLLFNPDLTDYEAKRVSLLKSPQG
jgi:hypothetical protein